MPTIGNLPSADVQMEFPDGKLRTINMLRLLVQAQNAEFKRDRGMFLPGVAKLNPTVKQMREAYPGIITARTWAEAAEQLRGFHTAIGEAVKEAQAS